MRMLKTLGVFSGLAILVGAAGVARAGDACKNVRFELVNNRSKTIVFNSVDYDNDVAANNPKHERIYNSTLERCYSGATCHSFGDNLTDAEGENLTNFVFHFNEYDSNGIKIDQDWITQPKVPDVKRCTANRTYGGSKDNPWTVN